MKRIRFTLALLLSVVLLISNGMSSLGEEYENVPTPDGGFTVTINPNTDDMGTHTYEAYQILTGTLAQEVDENGDPVEDENGIVYILSDIVWGSGITDEGKTALGGDTREAARAYAKALEAGNPNPVVAAAELEQYLSDTTTGTYADGAITGLAPGYYLIQDADDSPTGDDPSSKTKFILQVVANQTVTVKSSVPSVEKKVKEKNDSTGVETDWQDAADYDIGDIIPFKITATIGHGIEYFDGYSLVFVDDMSAGLTLKDWTIKIGDMDITDSFTKGTEEGSVYEGGTVHTWSIDDLRKAAPATDGDENGSDTTGTDPSTGTPSDDGGSDADGNEDPDAEGDNTGSDNGSGQGNDGTDDQGNTNNDGNQTGGEGNDEGGNGESDDTENLLTLTEGMEVVLEYTAELNENAVIGSAGNPNTTYIRFDDNPNHCGEGKPHGKTPKDKVTVFTFEINVLKVHATEEITEAQYEALDDEEKAEYVLIDGVYMKTEPLKGAGFTLFKWISPDQEADDDSEVVDPDDNQENDGSQTPSTENDDTTGDTPDAEGTDGGKADEQGGNEGTDTTEGDDDKPTDETGNDNEDPDTEEDEPSETEGEWVAVGAEVKAEDMTTFVFRGVDSGKYRLVETTVPAGYNAVDPIDFEVIAEYETLSDDPQLLDLSVKPEDKFSVVVEVTTDDEGEVVETTFTGVIETTILNVKGARLPGVGGIGTKIFYWIGGILVVAAGAVLVLKKRKTKEE